MKPLSPKQQRFVEEYARGATGVDAARLAGYSKKKPDVAACKLLKQKHIAEAVAAIRRQTSEQTGIDAAWVTNELVDTYRAARRVHEMGAAVRSLGLIGKNIGMFVDKHEHSGPNGGPMVVEIVRFSDANPDPA